MCIYFTVFEKISEEVQNEGMNMNTFFLMQNTKIHYLFLLSMG